MNTKIILSAAGIHKSYGDNEVLKPLSFEVRQGERVGLIGRNGSGKTTLLTLLSGAAPDGGTLFIAPGLRTETLSQFPVCPPGTTVEQALRLAFAPLQALERQIAQMQQHLAEGNLRDYDALVLRYELAGGYEQDLRYSRTVQGLGVTEAFSRRLFAELSGGEKTKVNLGRILMAQPDLLLLDEPTNHLDLRSIEWFEEFLQNYPGTVILISHDRAFLDRTVTRIFALQGGLLHDFTGNYTDYMVHRAQENELAEKRRAREEREIARLTASATRLHEWGVQTPRLIRAAMNMRRRIDRLKEEQTTHPLRDRRGIRASLSDGERSGDEVLYLRGVVAGYDHPLLQGIDLTLRRGERVALLGDNGSGKTTLLKLLTGELAPLCGAVEFGANVQMGYLPQHITFDRPDRTLLDTLLYSTKATAQTARDRLAAYDFVGEEVFKRVADLSGGERVRLVHCLLSFQPMNLFVLDEPTNHLDVASREWVETTLEAFDGSMLFVSHDRYFISRMATRIFSIEEGRVTDFAGGYEAWQAAREHKVRTLPTDGGKAASGATAARRAVPDKKSPLQAERALVRKLAAAERALAEKERALAAVEAEMTAAGSDYTALESLAAQYARLKEEADRLFEAWSELEELRDKGQSAPTTP